jgi:hypothetical protein
MITRELLDTDEWYVSINWLGLGAVYATSRKTGTIIKATTNEKLYLMQTMETLQRVGVPMTGDQRVLASLFADFAQAVHHRPKPNTFHGGAYYGLFFETFTPEFAAQRYLTSPKQQLK